jgi:hypothetical protein
MTREQDDDALERADHRNLTERHPQHHDRAADRRIGRERHGAVTPGACLNLRGAA